MSLSRASELSLAHLDVRQSHPEQAQSLLRHSIRITRQPDRITQPKPGTRLSGMRYPESPKGNDFTLSLETCEWRSDMVTPSHSSPLSSCSSSSMLSSSSTMGYISRCRVVLQNAADQASTLSRSCLRSFFRLCSRQCS